VAIGRQIVALAREMGECHARTPQRQRALDAEIVDYH
jgi:hypothetical protein